MKLITAFGIGYLFSWITHGRLFKRIRDMRYYINKRHYSLKTAWNLSGRTL